MRPLLHLATRYQTHTPAPLLPRRYAYALLYFTGSEHFNRSMRHYAKQRGYSLSDHGIVNAVKSGPKNVVRAPPSLPVCLPWKGSPPGSCTPPERMWQMRGTTNLVDARTEEDIFAALGLEYRMPEDRNCDVTAIGSIRGPAEKKQK